MDAVSVAARAIKSGETDLMIAGGVESMTRAPFVMGKGDTAFSRNAQIFDTTIGWRFINPADEEQIRRGFDAGNRRKCRGGISLSAAPIRTLSRFGRSSAGLMPIPLLLQAGNRARHGGAEKGRSRRFFERTNILARIRRWKDSPSSNRW